MLAQAKRLDNGEVVEGYYCPEPYQNRGTYHELWGTGSVVSWEIDPETLKYKIGAQWIAMEDLEALIAPVTSPREVRVMQVFNRDSPLEEALFVGICGLNLCKAKACITGIARLEIAKYGIEHAIKQIKANPKFK